MKKALHCFFVPCLVAAMSVAVIADESWVYDPSAKTLSCGNVVINNVNVKSASDKTLEIGNNQSNATAHNLDFSLPIDGGYSIYGFTGAAFSGNTYVTNVVLPGSLVSVGWGAVFENCANIDCEIGALPSGLSGNSGNLFKNCTKIHGEVIIPPGMVLNGQAFEKTGIQSVKFTEGFTTLTGSAFLRCNSLTNVVFPSTITTITGYGIFEGNKVLEYDLANFPTSVTALNQRLFCDCPKVVGDLFWPPLLAKSGIRSFYGTGITSLTAKHGLSTIDDATFSNCAALTNVVLSYDTMSISSTAFNSDGNLGAIYYRAFPSNKVNATYSGMPSGQLTHYITYKSEDWQNFAATNSDFTLPASFSGTGAWVAGGVTQNVKYWRDPDAAKMGSTIIIY